MARAPSLPQLAVSAITVALMFYLALTATHRSFTALSSHAIDAQSSTDIAPFESSPLFLIARGSSIKWQHTSHSDTPDNVAPSKRVHIGKADKVANLLQFAESKFPVGASVERHSHPTMTEIFHVKRGTVRFELDGGASQTLTADDTIVLRPGSHHSVRNVGDAEVVMVYASVSAE